MNLKTPIEELKLPHRVVTTLKAAQIDTLNELVQLSCEHILKFQKLGPTSLTEIEVALLKKNLAFGLQPKLLVKNNNQA